MHVLSACARARSHYWVLLCQHISVCVMNIHIGVTASHAKFDGAIKIIHDNSCHVSGIAPITSVMSKRMKVKSFLG